MLRPLNAINSRSGFRISSLQAIIICDHISRLLLFIYYLGSEHDQCNQNVAFVSIYFFISFFYLFYLYFHRLRNEGIMNTGMKSWKVRKEYRLSIF